MSRYSERVKKTTRFLGFLKAACEMDPNDRMEETVRFVDEAISLLEEMDERIDIMEEGEDDIK